MQLFYAPDIMPPLYALGEEESKYCVCGAADVSI